jgi:hypothetical protein
MNGRKLCRGVSQKGLGGVENSPNTLLYHTLPLLPRPRVVPVVTDPRLRSPWSLTPARTMWPPCPLRHYNDVRHVVLHSPPIAVSATNTRNQLRDNHRHTTANYLTITLANARAPRGLPYGWLVPDPSTSGMFVLGLLTFCTRRRLTRRNVRCVTSYQGLHHRWPSLATI